MTATRVPRQIYRMGTKHTQKKNVQEFSSSLVKGSLCICIKFVAALKCTVKRLFFFYKNTSVEIPVYSFALLTNTASLKV
jgi:hypothetical protein